MAIFIEHWYGSTSLMSRCSSIVIFADIHLVLRAEELLSLLVVLMRNYRLVYIVNCSYVVISRVYHHRAIRSNPHFCCAVIFQECSRFLCLILHHTREPRHGQGIYQLHMYHCSLYVWVNPHITLYCYRRDCTELIVTLSLILPSTAGLLIVWHHFDVLQICHL